MNKGAEMDTKQLEKEYEWLEHELDEFEADVIDFHRKAQDADYANQLVESLIDQKWKDIQRRIHDVEVQLYESWKRDPKSVSARFNDAFCFANLIEK